MQKNDTAKCVILYFCVIFFLAFTLYSCKKDKDNVVLPTISLVFDSDCTHDGDTVEIGRPLKFKVIINAPDINITNFTIKKVTTTDVKTVLDSGLNSGSFTSQHIYYQSIEDAADWTFTIMDRERNTATTSIRIYKDPNSQFGGILEYPSITLGYHSSNAVGHFFLPSIGKIYFEDTASLNQGLVDVMTYFNFKEDNGVMLPSPTFSSPGEETSATGDTYTLYYPFLTSWTTRNYTKWDIRGVNGVTDELYNNAHNDSLLIVSYDDVWGKKKYKWAMPGTYIPFQTAAGKRGLIKVLAADTVETGTITFAMKIQL